MLGETLMPASFHCSQVSGGNKRDAAACAGSMINSQIKAGGDLLFDEVQTKELGSGSFEVTMTFRFEKGELLSGSCTKVYDDDEAYMDANLAVALASRDLVLGLKKGFCAAKGEATEWIDPRGPGLFEEPQAPLRNLGAERVEDDEDEQIPDAEEG